MSKKSGRTHRITLYINSNSLKYCDSFGVNQIPKEIKKFIDNKIYHNKYLQNTHLWVNIVWILLHWIYWFYVQREKSGKLILATWFWKEWQSNSKLLFELKWKWYTNRTRQKDWDWWSIPAELETKSNTQNQSLRLK